MSKSSDNTKRSVDSRKKSEEVNKQPLVKNYQDESRKNNIKSECVTNALEKKRKESELSLRDTLPAGLIRVSMSEAARDSTVYIESGDRSGKQGPAMIKYMNTYRLESKNPFNREPVYNIIRDVFKAELETMSYEPTIFSKACAVIASEIRGRVKALGFDRYKLVCVVQVCEKNNQSVNSVSKFLWDPEKDNCACYNYENMYFLASGAVFGLYHE